MYVFLCVICVASVWCVCVTCVVCVWYECYMCGIRVCYVCYVGVFSVCVGVNSRYLFLSLCVLCV